MGNSIWRWIGYAFILAFFLRITGFVQSFWIGFAFSGLLFTAIYIIPQLPTPFYRRTAWIVFLVFALGYLLITFFRSTHPALFRALQNQNSYDDFLKAVRTNPNGAAAEIGGAEFCRKYEIAATNWYNQKLAQRANNFEHEFNLRDERVRALTMATQELLEEKNVIKRYKEECDKLVLDAQKEFPIGIGDRVIFKDVFLEDGLTKVRNGYGKVVGIKNSEALIRKDSDDKIISLPFSKLELETRFDGENNPSRAGYKKIFSLARNLDNRGIFWAAAIIIILLTVLGTLFGGVGVNSKIGNAIVRAVSIFAIFFIIYLFIWGNLGNSILDWYDRTFITSEIKDPREKFALYKERMGSDWKTVFIDLPQEDVEVDVRDKLPPKCYSFNLRSNTGEYYIKFANDNNWYNYLEVQGDREPVVALKRKSGDTRFCIRYIINTNCR